MGAPVLLLVGLSRVREGPTPATTLLSGLCIIPVVRRAVGPRRMWQKRNMSIHPEASQEARV